MTEPIIAKITDPEAGMVEMLQEAQLLINERDMYRRACAILQLFLAKADMRFDMEEIYSVARKELEREKINSGKVC